MKRTKKQSENGPIKKFTQPHHLYFCPAKFQPKRLNVIKNCAMQNGFRIVENFNNSVTVVVTEMETAEQVLNWLEINSLPEGATIVSTKWFFESIRLKIPLQTENYELRAKKIIYEPVAVSKFNCYACQRKTLLDHLNKPLVEGLEVLARHAEFRDEDNGTDYSRALAFQKAMSVLKCLPFTITKIDQVANLKDIGDHSKRVLEEIINDGYSTEVKSIKEDEWFLAMEELHKVYGIGSSIAKKLYKNGIKTVKDLKVFLDLKLKDSRIKFGIAFYDDLNCPVTLEDAQNVQCLITKHILQLKPGTRVELVGGFRRGKAAGHDVDFLISHPDGNVAELLDRIITKLNNLGYILHKDHIAKKNSSFNSANNKRNLTMDGFEKCFSIFKLPFDLQMDMLSEVLKLNLEALIEFADKPRQWKAVRVDFVVCPFDQFPYALLGWTGNKHFNRSLREYTRKELNMMLNSHGLYNNSNNESIPAKNEEEIFQHLKLDYIRPFERNA